VLAFLPTKVMKALWHVQNLSVLEKLYVVWLNNEKTNWHLASRRTKSPQKLKQRIM